MKVIPQHPSVMESESYQERYWRERRELRQAVEKDRSDAILTGLIVSVFGPESVDEDYLLEWHVRLHERQAHPACRFCGGDDE